MDQDWPDEARAGELLVNHMIGKGHHGVIEHPQLVVAIGGFPHSAIMQLRTHRHMSADVQSQRYTSKRILKVADGEMSAAELFYIRPEGNYTDRKGTRYYWSEENYHEDLGFAYRSALRYASRIRSGVSEEHARGIIAHDIRQNAVFSGNLRSWLHILALRHKADAQLEVQTFCEMLYPILEEWAPEVMKWHRAKHYKRGRMAF